jgi:hypothetical protein
LYGGSVLPIGHGSLLAVSDWIHIIFSKPVLQKTKTMKRNNSKNCSLKGNKKIEAKVRVFSFGTKKVGFFLFLTKIAKRNVKKCFFEVKQNIQSESEQFLVRLK